MNKAKQLIIQLITEKIERLSGKKVTFKEATRPDEEDTLGSGDWPEDEEPYVYKATNAFGMNPIVEFVFGNEKYQGYSERKLKSLVKRYEQEWADVKDNYKGDINAYIDELESNGDELEEAFSGGGSEQYITQMLTPNTLANFEFQMTSDKQFYDAVSEVIFDQEDENAAYNIWDDGREAQYNYIQNLFEGINELEEKVELDEYTDSEIRPARMARPDISNMTKSATAYWHDLYIQDEARDILQDKYGKDRGEKTFQGLIDARGGAFYQAVTQVVMEKAKMYFELGERLPHDYFSESYYDVWKRWMAKNGKTFKPAEPKVVPPPVAKGTPLAPVYPKAGSFDSKDEMRIQDLLSKAQMSSPNSLSPLGRMSELARQMANKITDKEKAFRRYSAAEDMNFHDVALIFYKRYKQLGGTQ